MATLDISAKPDVLAIAGGAILVALIDKLIEKGVLTKADAQAVMLTAMKNPFPQGAHGADLIIADLSRQFADRR
jgi:hypothetical protein